MKVAPGLKSTLSRKGIVILDLFVPDLPASHYAEKC